MTTPFELQTLARACALALLTTAAGATVAQTAASDVTRGAVAVTTTMGQLDSRYPVGRLIDQSGLSSPYVSGTTNFESYVATTTHLSSTGATWISQSGVPTGFLSFDLGAAYNIDGLAWFGAANGTYRVTAIKVYADNDADPTNGNAGLLFDSGTFGSSSGSQIKAPSLFSFSSITNTRYLDIEIVSNAGLSYSAAGEVIFRQTTAAIPAVPEPATYALMGLGLLAIGCAQRRRMAQR